MISFFALSFLYGGSIYGFFFFSIFCFLLFEIMSKENKCSLLQLNKGTGSNLTNTQKKKKKKKN